MPNVAGSRAAALCSLAHSTLSTELTSDERRDRVHSINLFSEVSHIPVISPVRLLKDLSLEPGAASVVRSGLLLKS